MKKIIIPDNFMGVPVDGAIKRVLDKPNSSPITTPQPIQTPHNDINGFIYVPDINLYVAKQTAYHNLNWKQAHEELQKDNKRMLIPSEFFAFLKYIKSNNQFKDIYNEITEQRDPWRSEWIDAYFEQKDDKMYILTRNKTNSEILQPCLMKDKTPGIDLESLMNNPTKQGLPNEKIKKGSLYYWCPRNGAVAWFCAYSGRALFYCFGDPSNSIASLWVRPSFAR